MNLRWPMCLVAAAMLYGISLGTTEIRAAELPPDYEFQASVETYVEGRLQESLAELLGTDRFIPVVHADVGTQVVDPGRARDDDGPSALPGVPVKKKLGMEGDKREPGLIRYVRRINVTLYLDTGISGSTDELITDVAKGIMKFDPRRGDEVSIKRIDLGQSSIDLGMLLRPPNLYWTLLVATGTVFLLAASLFLLNPLRKLPGVLGDVNWDVIRGGQARGGEGSAGPTIETHNVFQTAPPAAEKSSSVDGETPLPFSFVEARHLGSLAYLCREKPDRDIATISSYLASDQVSEFLEYFSADRQASVAVELSGTREIEPAEVRALEDDVRTRLDYLIGGELKLLNIMDRTSDEVREKVFSVLRERDAVAAERLGKKIKSFETVLSELTAEAIQVLNRRLDPAILAQLLRTVPEELREKVFGSVSAGVAERLRQEMDMSRPLSAVRVNREKKNVVALVRQLINEGMIEEA